MHDSTMREYFHLIHYVQTAESIKLHTTVGLGYTRGVKTTTEGISNNHCGV